MKRVMVIVVLGLALAGCNQPGEVVGRDKDCLPGSTDEKPLCTYQLTTVKDGKRVAFDVIKDVYEKCQIGENYPECGD